MSSYRFKFFPNSQALSHRVTLNNYYPKRLLYNNDTNNSLKKTSLPRRKLLFFKERCMRIILLQNIVAGQDFLKENFIDHLLYIPLLFEYGSKKKYSRERNEILHSRCYLQHVTEGTTRESKRSWGTLQQGEAAHNKTTLSLSLSIIYDQGTATPFRSIWSSSGRPQLMDIQPL